MPCGSTHASLPVLANTSSDPPDAAHTGRCPASTDSSKARLACNLGTGVCTDRAMLARPCTASVGLQATADGTSRPVPAAALP